MLRWAGSHELSLCSVRLRKAAEMLPFLHQLEWIGNSDASPFSLEPVVKYPALSSCQLTVVFP